jgi:hypothetical protein
MLLPQKQEYICHQSHGLLKALVLTSLREAQVRGAEVLSCLKHVTGIPYPLPLSTCFQVGVDG